MSRFSKILLAISLGVVTLVQPISGVAKNDNYPNKKIRIVVPYPAGGGTDILARIVAKELSEDLGETVWVENKPGASGTIGTNMIAKAKPDGYDILLGITTALVIAPRLYDDIQYQASDFEAIAEMAETALFLVVNSDLNIDTLDDFIDYAKKNPGKLSYGSFGVGTSSHLFGEQLNLDHDIDLLHIAFKGSGPLVNSLLAQDVSAAIVDSTSIKSHLDSDKFKVLAVTGTERIDLMPEIKTFKELGYDGFEEVGWFGFFAPKGTPSEVVNLLHEKITAIQQKPEVNEKIVSFGLQNTPVSLEEFKKVYERSDKNYGVLFDKTKITVD